MHDDKPTSRANADRPRHSHQEIADLLAVALLRLRTEDLACDCSATAGAKDEVHLGFSAHQRVNTNPYQQEGARV
jgi:hypothetical protein